MSAEFFLDTNILVYSFDSRSESKAAKARTLIEEGLVRGHGAISWQVIQEFCNLALRKFAVPMSPSECRLYMQRVLVPLCAVWPSERLFEEGLELSEETGFAWYDCLILAGAIQSGAKRLLTEDMQNGRRVRTIEIVNPFV